VGIAAAFLLVAAALFLLRVALRRPSANFALASGACLALTAWFLPSALLAVPVLAAPLLDRRWPVRARVHLAGSGLLGLAAVLLPWVLSRV
jgi:4-amino-4-deoxy-L-arabinose transferase-like glycosyltransferase